MVLRIGPSCAVSGRGREMRNPPDSKVCSKTFGVIEVEIPPSGVEKVGLDLLKAEVYECAQSAVLIKCRVDFWILGLQTLVPSVPPPNSVMNGTMFRLRPSVTMAR